MVQTGLWQWCSRPLSEVLITFEPILICYCNMPPAGAAVTSRRTPGNGADPPRALHSLSRWKQRHMRDERRWTAEALRFSCSLVGFAVDYARAGRALVFTEEDERFERWSSRWTPLGWVSEGFIYTFLTTMRGLIYQSCQLNTCSTWVNFNSLRNKLLLLML